MDPRFPGRRGVVSEGERRLPAAPVSSLSRRHHAGRGGRSPSSRVMWESIRQSAEIEWLRNESERRLAQLTALDSIEQLQQIVDTLTVRTVGRRPAGQPWPVPCGGATYHAIPRGTMFELDASGRVRLSPQSHSFPCLSSRNVRARRFHDAGVNDRRRHHWRHRRQLSQRVHLSAAAREVDRLAGFRLHQLRAPPGLVREHPDPQLSGAARPLPDLRAFRSQRSTRSSRP